MLGRFRFLYRDDKWKEACRTVVSVCDEYVGKALYRLQKREKAAKNSNDCNGARDGSETGLRLIDEMAKETQYPYDLHRQMIGVFSPAHDGAAVALSNALFHLARRPREWDRHR